MKELIRQYLDNGLSRRQLVAGLSTIPVMRETGTTVFHPTSTCRMGPDPTAVVDERLRVRGVERLRVVDGSIMPALVSGNTNAAIVMIGEKGADMIQQDAAQSTAIPVAPRAEVSVPA